MTEIDYIEKMFSNLLHMEVRVVHILNDEENEFSIYKKNLYPADISDQELMDFGPDFGLFEYGDWVFYYGVSFEGSYANPPSFDLIESKEKFTSFSDALNGLYLFIVNQQYEDFMINIQME